MDARLFWKVLGVQAVAVAVLSGILLVLPLPADFFADWGAVAGPIAWLLCSLVTARALSLRLAFALFSALVGGAAGAIVMLVTSHWVGVLAALLVFAGSCAGYDRRPSAPRRRRALRDRRSPTPDVAEGG